MARLQIDLDIDDILIVPTDSGAQIRVLEKSGRRARLSVESAKPVQVLRARDQRKAPDLQRPKPTLPQGFTKPRA